MSNSFEPLIAAYRSKDLFLDRIGTADIFVIVLDFDSRIFGDFLRMGKRGTKNDIFIGDDSER